MADWWIGRRAASGSVSARGRGLTSRLASRSGLVVGDVDGCPVGWPVGCA